MNNGMGNRNKVRINWKIYVEIEIYQFYYKFRFILTSFRVLVFASSRFCRVIVERNKSKLKYGKKIICDIFSYAIWFTLELLSMKLNEIILWSKSKLNFTSCYGNSHDPVTLATSIISSLYVSPSETSSARESTPNIRVYVVNLSTSLMFMHTFRRFEQVTLVTLLPGEKRKFQGISYDPSRINVIAKFAHENVNFSAIYRRD